MATAAKEQGPENTTTMEMEQDKTTSGTVRFREIRSDDERQHTFYMMKGLFNKLGRPDTIVLTIETD